MNRSAINVYSRKYLVDVNMTSIYAFFFQRMALISIYKHTIRFFFLAIEKKYVEKVFNSFARILYKNHPRARKCSSLKHSCIILIVH